MASAFKYAGSDFTYGGFVNRYLPLAIVALLNFLLFTSISGYGLALSVDSANYFSVAESLAKGHGFLQFDDFPFLNAPPLYPILIAPTYLFQLPVQFYAVALQFSFFNLFLFFQYKLIHEELKLATSWLYLWLSGGFYFVFVHAFVFALSEAGFIALLSIWFYLLIKEESTRKVNWHPVVFALLCMQRYAIWLILPGMVVYWLTRKKPFLYIVKQVYLGVGVSAFWLLRNLLVSGKILGEHRVQDKLSFSAFYDNCLKLVELLINQRNLGISTLLFLGLLFLGFINLKKLTGKQYNLNLMVVLAASGFLILLFFQKQLSLVQLPRYLVVFWPLLLLLPSLFLNALNKNKIVVGTTLLLLISSTLFSLHKLSEFRIYGHRGFNSEAWQNIKNEGKLRLAAGNYVSNYPDMVWWITGRHCQYTPFYNNSQTGLADKVIGKDILIWFYNPERNQIMRDKSQWLSELKSDTLFSTNDFIVYNIGKP